MGICRSAMASAVQSGGGEQSNRRCRSAHMVASPKAIPPPLNHNRFTGFKEVSKPTLSHASQWNTQVLDRLPMVGEGNMQAAIRRLHDAWVGKLAV